MKFPTYAEYDPSETNLSEPSLLTVWAGLGNYHQELVLIGGLVPRYICRHPVGESPLPRPATLDVDLGIALGASAGQYGSLMYDLRAQGFLLSKKYPSRFERMINNHSVYLDFLVEMDSASQGTVVVDDVPANILPGIDRALQTAQTIAITGTDLFGAQQTQRIRVCSVGAFLVLKLRAFAKRQQSKDAFDILYTVMNYMHGADAAAHAFAEEVRGISGNSAAADAVESLKAHFLELRHAAPLRAAHFVCGERSPLGDEALETQRQQIKEMLVIAGQKLLKAIQ